MESIGDIFESSLNLEETHFKEGYDEGYADGLVSGKEESCQVGLKTGFEVGEELGFYRGCIDVWKSAIRIDPNCFSFRVQKTINQMDELLHSYPISDPENESVSDIMDSLRLKFRAVCATLNMKLEYNGYPKASDGCIGVNYSLILCDFDSNKTWDVCNLYQPNSRYSNNTRPSLPDIYDIQKPPFL